MLFLKRRKKQSWNMRGDSVERILDTACANVAKEAQRGKLYKILSDIESKKLEDLFKRAYLKSQGVKIGKN